MTPTTTAPYLRRAVLRDPDAERELCEDGFTVIDLLDGGEVAELYDLYVAHAERGDLNPEGAYNDTFAEFTTMNSRTDFRPVAFEAITRVAVPRAAEHLVGYRPVVANYVNKPPGGRGVVPVHQNMSVVDEDELRSVSVWIALVDCSPANGTLEVIRGTHRTFRGRRGTWAYAEFMEVDHQLLARHLEPISVRAGQAIVLDDALVHYSPPNGSDARRLAIQLVMSPAEAPARYYEQVALDDETVTIDVLAVEPDFFYDFWGGIGDRAHATVLDRMEVPRVRHTDESLAVALGDEAWLAGAGARPGPEAQQEVAPGADDVAGDDAPGSSRPAGPPARGRRAGLRARLARRR